MKKPGIGRRSFLKGAGAAAVLPFLEGPIPAGAQEVAMDTLQVIPAQARSGSAKADAIAREINRVYNITLTIEPNTRAPRVRFGMRNEFYMKPVGQDAIQLFSTLVDLRLVDSAFEQLASHGSNTDAGFTFLYPKRNAADKEAPEWKATQSDVDALMRISATKKLQPRGILLYDDDVEWVDKFEKELSTVQGMKINATVGFIVVSTGMLKKCQRDKSYAGLEKEIDKLTSVRAQRFA